MDVKEKLVELLGRVQQMGVIYRENQMDERYPTIEQIRNTEVAARLIANGVTVQEWISVKEPPKEKGTYIVCTDNGGILLGHWYGTAWNAGGGANKHLAYWMEKPQPPEGE